MGLEVMAVILFAWLDPTPDVTVEASPRRLHKGGMFSLFPGSEDQTDQSRWFLPRARALNQRMRCEPEGARSTSNCKQPTHVASAYGRCCAMEAMSP